MLTWDTAAWVVGAVFAAIAIAIAVIELLRARGSNDDGDDDPGSRRGPEQPRGDPGPSGTDPTWWPEFERQFAAYTEDAARRTADRVHP